MRTIKSGDYVFPGMGRGDLTVHGFRSAFRDWATEHDKVRKVVAEAALARGVRDKAEAAHRRATYLDERTKLMQRWAAYCDSKATTGQVVALR